MNIPRSLICFVLCFYYLFIYFCYSSRQFRASTKSFLLVFSLIYRYVINFCVYFILGKTKQNKTLQPRNNIQKITSLPRIALSEYRFLQYGKTSSFTSLLHALVNINTQKNTLIKIDCF